MALLEVTNIKKIYSTRFGGNKVQALSNVTFSVEEGEFVAIMGESGSGKTTLLNILASVSYTHLGFLSRIFLLVFRGLQNSGSYLPSGTPVSYTHLDVYKRQRLCVIPFVLLLNFSGIIS